MRRKYSGKIEFRKKNFDNFEKEIKLAKLAIYDTNLVPPRVIDLVSEDTSDFMAKLSEETYKSCLEQGGRIPYMIIKEVCENLIHAYFKEPVISVMNKGNTIRISDQGDGIKDKQKAFLPGFSTAKRLFKKYIRGVGSGLPLIKESVELLGGSVVLEDNMEKGTVITINLPQEEQKTESHTQNGSADKFPDLTEQQKEILLLISELGEVGPSQVAKELKISVASSFRELDSLEKLLLLKKTSSRKRALTEEGIKYLTLLFK